ncbi:hypothetical protein [Haloarcula montana]|uniref:hypothetical protein n=1 Tax=Haloarcula montana TaxID=3111776 RepID=UPI002D76C40A|nr:hypothetical protein [Haloarcula sp. GH36]
MLSRLRNPEYTGANRCLPCTVVNSVIAVTLAGAVGVGVATVATPVAGGVAALLVLAGSALSIWLRGYLVPGTPELTKRYMPPWLLAWFGKGPAAETGTSHFEEEDIELETMLLELDVLEPCDDVDDLCLTDSFDEAWTRELRQVPEDIDPRRVVELLGLEAAEVGIQQFDDAVTIHRDGGRLGQWPSKTALRVDVAAARTLAEWTDEWAKLSPGARGETLAGLRVFVRECPDGSAATFTTETVESCCSNYEVVTVRCEGTGDRLLEQPVN